MDWFEALLNAFFILVGGFLIAEVAGRAFQWIITKIPLSVRYKAWKHRKAYPRHPFLSTTTAYNTVVGAACIKCEVVYFGDDWFVDLAFRQMGRTI